jgi:hypothetical protein
MPKPEFEFFDSETLPGALWRVSQAFRSEYLPKIRPPDY